jgi:soluble lytic murein transglycosylase-like protein
MRTLRPQSAWSLTIALLGGLCLANEARSAERITLTNGFDVVCHHHALVDGRVRVYLKPAEADYFEVAPEAVSAVEAVPDPPVAAQLPDTKGKGMAGKAVAERPLPVSEVKNIDVRLTSADLHQLLSRAGSEHNVDEDLLASVVKAESGGYAHAVSRAGARGLMQLMPGTAQQLGVADSFAPEQNVRGGTAYLDTLLTRYHDNIALALAAYNAGPEAVDRYHGIPPYRETRVYVARVVHEFNRRVSARRAASGSNADSRSSAVSRANSE